MVITLPAFTSEKRSHRSARNEQNTMSGIIDSLDQREYGSEYVDSNHSGLVMHPLGWVQGMSK
jgi:hypothetical protein